MLLHFKVKTKSPNKTKLLPLTTNTHGSQDSYSSLRKSSVGIVNSSNNNNISDKWIAPEKWDLSIKRNVLCEICNQNISFCPSIDAYCSLCNVVAHITCLSASDRKLMYRNCWICRDCHEEINYSKDKYLAKKKDESYKKASQEAQVKIAKIWRGRQALQKYRRIYKIIVKMQQSLRTFQRRNLLQAFRKTIPRPLGVKVVRAFDLPKADWDTGKADPYVLITVVEPEDYDSQIWSLQTNVIQEELNPVWNEEFVIPGITGHQLLVFTIIDQDDLRDQCIGQVCISLNTNDVWKFGGKFILPLLPVKYVPTDIGAGTRIDYSTIKPAGLIEIHLKVLNSMSACCGYIYGPSVEDFKRGITRLFESLESKDTHKANNFLVKPQTKKIWLLIYDGKLHFYRSIGEPCRFIIDLSQTVLTLRVKDQKLHFEFKFQAPGIPNIIFSAIENADTIQWKTSFIAAWRQSRSEGGFNVLQLVRDLVSFKKRMNQKEEEADNVPTPTLQRLPSVADDLENIKRAKATITQRRMAKLMAAPVLAELVQNNESEDEGDNDFAEIPKRRMSMFEVEEEQKRQRVLMASAKFGVYLVQTKADNPILMLKSRTAQMKKLN